MNPISLKKLSFLGLIAWTLAMPTLRADTLAYYNFGPDNGTATTNPATVAPNLTASAISNNPVSPLSPWELGNAYAYPTKPVLRVGDAVASTTAAAAVANNQYFTFSVTANPGYLLTGTNLTFNASRGGTSTPRGYVVRTSVNNFASDLAADAVATNRPVWTNINIPLGATFVNQTAVTFRIYVYAPGTGSSLEFDDITVNGLVVPSAAPPVITRQPLSQTVGAGASPTFSVAAGSATPISYLWYTNGSATNLVADTSPNGTNATYTLANAAVGDNGRTFQAVLTNLYGASTSAVAQLTVTESPFVLTQPASLTITEGQSAAFSLLAVGRPPLAYQWYYATNSLPLTGAGTWSTNALPGATGTNLALTRVLPIPFNGAKFWVAITNSLGTATSSTATLTVNRITAAPTVAQVVAGGFSNAVLVYFSLPVTTPTALNPANYAVLPTNAGVTVAGVRRGLDNKSVAVAVSGLVDGTYSLSVSNVQDAVAQTPNTMTAANVAFTFASSNFIVRKYYAGLSTSDGSVGGLTNSAAFLNDLPTYITFPVSLEGPTNFADGYGTRFQGYVLPSVTTNYNFYIASDDNSELWLSPDASPARMTLIAREEQNNVARDWVGTTRRTTNAATGLPYNQSAPIALVAGNRYYLEVRHKEGAGSDDLGVTWWKPGDPAIVAGAAPIPGANLAPAGFTVAPVMVTNPLPSAVAVLAGTPVPLSIGVDGLPPYAYQWQLNGVNIPNATNRTYTVTTTTADDGKTYGVVVNDPYGLPATSQVAFQVLGAPLGLVARGGVNQITVGWTAESTATNYVLSRSSSAGGPFTPLLETAGTSHLDAGLADGATFYYVVLAQGPLGQSLNSAPVVASTRPPAPVGVVATPGDTQITLGWPATPAATGYYLKGSATAGGPYTVLATNGSPSFVQRNLSNLTPYYFVVSAFNAAGESADSLEVSATPSPAPAGLMASGGPNQVVLQWAPMPGASSYTVKRGEVSGLYSILVSGVTEPSYTDTGLPNGTAFYYVVSAQLVTGGTSANSAEARAVTVLPTPVEVSAAGVSLSEVDVSWRSGGPGATGYRLERSLDGNTFTLLANLDLAVTTYQDKAVTSGTAYSYRVSAFNSVVQSGPSLPVKAGAFSAAFSVNFGLASATDFYPGYLQDNSLVFADRGNGYTYGWDADNTANARERANAASPDKRFDTLTHLQKQVPTRVWEIVVPNGNYVVHLVAGDPTAKDSYHRLLAETNLIVNTDVRTVSSNYAWAEGSGLVTVSDGRLTVKADDVAGVNTKLCFLNVYGPSVPPTFLTQPTNLNPIELDTATFAATVSGSAPVFFQWYFNGSTALAGQTNSSLVIPDAPLSAAGTYEMVASNFMGVVTSSVVTLTIVQDAFAPTLAMATGDATLNRASVTFSERVTGATGTNLANYVIRDATGATLPIASATLFTDRKTVVFATAPQTPGLVYTVTVNHVTDISPQANMIAADSQINFTGWVETPFTLLAEIFTGLSNSDVASLTNSTKFQLNQPDYRFYLSKFYWRSSEMLPAAGLDNYGSRISGFFIPPSNGLYRFFLASDEASQLFLNPSATGSDNPAGKVLIARNDAARAYYTNNDASMSTNLYLVGGQRYYIEALQKDGTGDDSLAVTYRGVPDDVTLPAPPAGTVPSIESISGPALSTYSDPAAASLFVTASPPEALSLTENDFLTLHALASAVPSNMPVYYVWQRYDPGTSLWTEVPGARSTNLAFYVPLADNQAQYRINISTVGHATNFTTALSVVADSEPPFLVSAGSTDGRTIVVRFNERVAPATAQEGLNWVVTAQDGTYPEVAPSIRSNYVVGVPRVYYDQAILTLATPIFGAFLVEALNMSDWAEGANANSSSTVSGTVQNLIVQDVGPAGTDPIVPGGAYAFAPDNLDVAAGGSDIWGTADGFHYVYRPVTGNFDLKVRINNLAAANAWSKAGLMARVSTNGNSRNVCLLAAPPNGQNTYTFQWRDTDGGASSSVNSAAAAPPFNILPTYTNAWVRLQRIGSVLTGLISSNGTDWTVYTNHQTAILGNGYPATVLVGLAVTAHDNTGANRLTLAEFRDLYFPAAPVIITQPEPAVAELAIHQSISYTVAALSDPGAGPLTYQWRKDGVDLPGATAATLTLDPLSVANSGVYTVLVANDGGGVMSLPVSLAITNFPPTVTAKTATTQAGVAMVLPGATLLANDVDPEGDPLALLAVSGVAPVTFAADFNDGLLPANTAIYGNATLIGSGGVSNSGCLHLTEAAGTQSGAFVISNLVPGRAVSAFTARFRLRMGDASAAPADGFSFNLASDLVDGTATNPEEGVGTGLSICIDTYNNNATAPEAPAIEVKYTNAFLGRVPIPAFSTPRWIEMVVDLKADGRVTVRFDGTNVFADLPTGYVPIANSRIGFYARTGGSYESHWVDDLSFTLLTADTALGAWVTLDPTTGVVTYQPGPQTTGLDTFYYLVTDGQVNGVTVGTLTVEVAEAVRPALTIERAGADVLVKWPAALGEGWQLQSAPQLPSSPVANVWTDVLGTPETVNEMKVLRLPSGEAQQFFQLKKR